MTGTGHACYRHVIRSCRCSDKCCNKREISPRHWRASTLRGQSLSSGPCRNWPAPCPTRERCWRYERDLSKRRAFYSKGSAVPSVDSEYDGCTLGKEAAGKIVNPCESVVAGENVVGRKRCVGRSYPLHRKA